MQPLAATGLAFGLRFRGRMRKSGKNRRFFGPETVLLCAFFSPPGPWRHPVQL